MKTTFDEEEDLSAQRYQRDPNDREITLGSATLLAIFFGLVLLCGLFFGMGYTLGRRAPVQTAADAADRGTTAALISDGRSKPSASAQAPVPQPMIDDTPTPDPQPDAGSSGASGDTSAGATKAQVQETALQTATVKPAMPTPSDAATRANGISPNGIMVQIAAVSNQPDADVLVGALRRHGYTVTVRRDAADALLHVQVGPFATRAEANAMRQKLLADGYNAILK